MVSEKIDVSVKWPFKWCLVGSSGSGKTNFSLQVIRHAHRLFDQVPTKIIIVFKEYQEIYNQFNDFIPTDLINALCRSCNGKVEIGFFHY